MAGEPGSQPSGQITEHAGDLRKVAAGTSINFFGSFVRTVSAFFYAVFLAIFLDQASVGLYFLGFTIMTLLGTAATIGLETGVVRFTALYDGEGDDGRVRGTIAGALAVAAPVGLATGMILFLFAANLSVNVFGKPDLADVLKLFAPAVPLFVMARVFNAGTQGLRHMRYQVYSRDIAEQLSRFIISAAFLIAGFGLMWVVGANLGALFIALSLSFFFLHRVKPVFNRQLRRVYGQRQLLSYSAPVAMSTILSLLLLWTDTLFLGHFGSAEEVGIYSMAMRLAMVGSVILVSFNTMIAPLISDLFNRGERVRLENLLKSVTKWAVGLSLPVFAGLALFPEQALRIMGSEYLVGANALIILAAGQLINTAAGPAALVLMMCGRPRYVLFSNIIVYVVDIVLCFILIPRFGIEGAAFTWTITLLLFNAGALIGLIMMLKLIPFSFGYGKIVAAGALAVALAIILQHLLPGGTGLAVSFAVFALSYLAIILKTGFDYQDKMLIKAIRLKLAGSRE